MKDYKKSTGSRDFQDVGSDRRRLEVEKAGDA